ncbi:pentapeptide repeat-containing protein [Streptomyces calidiresistens]
MPSSARRRSAPARTGPRTGPRPPAPPRPPEISLPILRPAPGPPYLGPGSDHDAEEFTGVDLSGEDGGGAAFLECLLRDCVLDETRLRGARLVDSLLENVRGLGVGFAEGVLRDVEWRDARLGGAQFFGAELNRVVFRGGKIDYANFRQAGLTDVAFVNCVLVEPDFGGAKLERVSFEGCEVRGADLSAVRMTDVDLRGVTGLEIARGVESLAGAVVTPTQLLDLAPVLAAHLGLRVEP